MYTFIIAIIALILGFFLYGRFVERTFGIEAARETPAYRLKDGVDYIPMPTWRVYLIQFLNIAGTGPIFGAIMGICPRLPLRHDLTASGRCLATGDGRQ